MLIQFSVTNFKTFKDKATLSLTASNYDKEKLEAENVFAEPNFGYRLLKSAVIYGAMQVVRVNLWMLLYLCGILF